MPRANTGPASGNERLTLISWPSFRRRLTPVKQPSNNLQNGYIFREGAPMMHLTIFVTALEGSEEVKNRKLWQWLGVVFVLSFAALGFLGREIYLAAPPIATVVTSDGR